MYDTDLTLCGCVQDWVVSHKRAGVQPVISNPSRQIMRLLEKAHIPELIGEEYITVRMADAVALCQVRPAASLEPCSASSALLLLPAVSTEYLLDDFRAEGLSAATLSSVLLSVSAVRSGCVHPRDTCKGLLLSSAWLCSRVRWYLFGSLLPGAPAMAWPKHHCSLLWRRACL